MLPVEREMIGLLMRGASTPLENIQVSFFLVGWSSFLLTVLRMVRNEKETKGLVRAEGLREFARDSAERNGGKAMTEARFPSRRRFKSK